MRVKVKKLKKLVKKGEYKLKTKEIAEGMVRDEKLVRDLTGIGAKDE